MSADDGFILRQDEQGKYVLQHYFASAGYPPIEDPITERFDTIEEALLKYQMQDPTEYGLTVDINPTKESKMQPQKFTRKPFEVDAMQITADNMAEVAKWCDGEIRNADDGAQFIKVRVQNPMTERQTRGFVGDWILYSGRGYKVYTEKAFRNSFERPSNTTPENEQEVRNVFENSN